ncbi:unnamed protein product [Lactuca virosa]|uniref:Uncharacterized protein n=1 Tax=Lactuca virosa TaxID=75947 RepID=A0AAU9PDK7_9ASTR|nr:unnamed protein product [Lactuca virosa]
MFHKSESAFKLDQIGPREPNPFTFPDRKLKPLIATTLTLISPPLLFSPPLTALLKCANFLLVEFVNLIIKGDLHGLPASVI